MKRSVKHILESPVLKKAGLCDMVKIGFSLNIISTDKDEGK